MCEKHSIEIKNLSENEHYSREIVLIRGTIKNLCNQQFIEFTFNDSSESKEIIFNGNFKILLRLERDVQNLLKIRYCNTVRDIILHHKSIDPVFFDIQPLYIIPKNHDGCFQSDDPTTNSVHYGIEKIDLILKLAQCVISSKIYECESQEKAFVLQKCKIFRCKLNVEDAQNMNQWELYDKIAHELICEFGCDIGEKRKFIGFMSSTKFLGMDANEDYNYINIKNRTLGNPSLGSGFLALMGNGCFYALPNKLSDVLLAFNNKRIVDISQLLDDSNYRKTYGGCFSTFLGSLIHEVGHTLDLAHNNSGLMGTDIDHVHRFFVSQYFTEVMPKRNIKNCQHNKKNETIANNRITKIKNNGCYMDRYHEQKNNDLTFFEPNCSIILANHKWFTQNRTEDIINIEENDGTILLSSYSYIILVEIRESEANNSVLIKYFDLRDRMLNKFNIPHNIRLKNVTVFAINANGCSLRKHYNNEM